MTDGDGRTITVTIAIPPKYAVLQVIDFIKGQNEHHRAVAPRMRGRLSDPAQPLCAAHDRPYLYLATILLYSPEALIFFKPSLML